MPPGDSAALGQALSDPPSEPPRAQGTANTRAGVSTEPPIRPRCLRPAVPGGPDAGTAEGGAARPQDADTCFGALSSLWGTCLLDTLAQRQAELPAQRPSPVMHPTPPPRAPHLPEAPPPATPMSFLRRRGRSQWPRSMNGGYVSTFALGGKWGLCSRESSPMGEAGSRGRWDPSRLRARALVGPGVWACRLISHL